MECLTGKSYKEIIAEIKQTDNENKNDQKFIVKNDCWLVKQKKTKKQWDRTY